jgi:hypothetical protein
MFLSIHYVIAHHINDVWKVGLSPNILQQVGQKKK